MKVLSLNDDELSVLNKMIDKEIESFKSRTDIATPFYIADVISIYRKLKKEPSLDNFPSNPMPPKVINPIKVIDPVSIPKVELPKDQPPKTVTTENIDTMTEKLLPPDNLDEIEVQKIHEDTKKENIK